MELCLLFYIVENLLSKERCDKCKLPDPPMVCVTWLDAETEEGWTDIDEAIKDKADAPTTCKTMGFLLHNDDKVVTIVGSINEYQYGEVTKIPKGMVIKIEGVSVAENSDTNI